MGIVNIEDELHDQLRRASKVSCRSINAQAAWWIKIGMLAETNPALSFAQIIEREMRAAGVSAAGIMAPPLHDVAQDVSRDRAHDEAA
jgi:hypothetical protein